MSRGDPQKMPRPNSRISILFQDVPVVMAQGGPCDRRHPVEEGIDLAVNACDDEAGLKRQPTWTSG